MLKSLPAALKGVSKGEAKETAGYQYDFDQAPGSLQDEDDDEEDVGRADLNGDLNYDSDEKEGEGNELITIVDQPRKAVPKLKRPT